MSDRPSERPSAPAGGEPRRLRDGGAGPGSERAARLLGLLASPPPLSSEAMARIARRLGEPAAVAPLPRHRLPLLTVGVAAAALGVLFPVGLARLRPAAPSSVALSRPDVDVAALSGGAAVVQPDGVVRIDRGRVVVRSGQQGARLSFPGAIVALRPASILEVDAVEQRVACYAGSASVAFTVVDETYELRAGSEAAPRRQGRVDAGRRAEVLAALPTVGGAAPVAPPAEGQPAGAPRSPPLPSPLTPAAAPTPPPSPPTLSLRRLSGPAARRGPTNPDPGDPRALPVVAAAVAAPSPTPATRPAAEGGAPPTTAAAPATPATPAAAPPGGRHGLAGEATIAASAFEAEGEAAPAAVAPSRRGDEARLLGRALSALRRDDQPAAALALLDEHSARFPGPAFAAEAVTVRIDALLALDRRADALALLDERPLGGSAADRRLRVLRAELRAGAGRCAEAVPDLDVLCGALDGVGARALYARAACRARLGNHGGARADLQEYLERFPTGRMVDRVKASLLQ